MNLEGKIALVTGGASGLGAATTRELVAGGAKVVIVDLNDELGAAMEAEHKGAVVYAKADVSDEAQSEAAVARAVSEFGALHILLNVAGIGGSRRVVGKEGPVDLAWFKNIINVNLIGTFNMTRLAAAVMIANDPNEDGERGVIINTASIAAMDGQIGQVAYSASKGGIVGMTLPLARDLSRHGIRVATIAPGIFDTPLLAKLPDDVRAALGASVPFPPRLGRPKEYAQLARQIIENSMLNGEVIRLDGALRMAPR